MDLDGRRARRLALCAALALGLLLVWLLAATGAMRSLADVCAAGGPPATTSVSQSGSVLPPRLRCTYATPGGAVVERRDDDARVRALGLAVWGAVLASASVVGTRALLRPPE